MWDRKIEKIRGETDSDAAQTVSLLDQVHVQRMTNRGKFMSQTHKPVHRFLQGVP